MADFLNLGEIGETFARGVTDFFTPEQQESGDLDEPTMVARARQAAIALSLVNTGFIYNNEKTKVATEQQQKVEAEAQIGAMATDVKPVPIYQKSARDLTDRQIKAVAEEHAKQQPASKVPDLTDKSGVITVERAQKYLEEVLNEAA